MRVSLNQGTEMEMLSTLFFRSGEIPESIAQRLFTIMQLELFAYI